MHLEITSSILGEKALRLKGSFDYGLAKILMFFEASTIPSIDPTAQISSTFSVDLTTILRQTFMISAKRLFQQ
jgi:hypothetical protein